MGELDNATVADRLDALGSLLDLSGASPYSVQSSSWSRVSRALKSATASRPVCISKTRVSPGFQVAKGAAGRPMVALTKAGFRAGPSIQT